MNLSTVSIEDRCAVAKDKERLGTSFCAWSPDVCKLLICRVWLWYIHCLYYIVLLMFRKRYKLWDIIEMSNKGGKIPTSLIYHTFRRSRQTLVLCGSSMTNCLIWSVTCFKGKECVLWDIIHDKRYRRLYNIDVLERLVLTSEHFSLGLAKISVEDSARCWGRVGYVVAYSWRAAQYRWWENVCPSRDPTSAIVLMKADSSVSGLYICPRH
jgi:hypothetical protein